MNPPAKRVLGSGLQDGQLTLFVRHTSCSLLIQENADPDVRRGDLRAFFARLALLSSDPSMAYLRQTYEGAGRYARAYRGRHDAGQPVYSGEARCWSWKGAGVLCQKYL